MPHEPVREQAFSGAGIVGVGTILGQIISLAGCKRVGLQFIRTNHTSGSSIFSVLVSNDGLNWVAFNKLIDNVANTNAQTLTRVASSTLAANVSKIYDMDLEQGTYNFMQVQAVTATDGNAQCVLLKEREM